MQKDIKDVKEFQWISKDVKECQRMPKNGIISKDAKGYQGCQIGTSVDKRVRGTQNNIKVC